MRIARRLAICAAAALGALALLVLPGAAAAGDGNHDRIPDSWEHRHHLSTSVDQAGRDQDHDRLRNRAEFLAGDNPRDRDTDDDGVIDGEENAGTIQFFDAESGRLVIDLFGGEEISGLVTDGTRIKCEDEPGEGGGGHGEEPGDHRGEDNSGPGDGEDANCASSELIAGATVKEAELELENGVATFEEVELAG